MGSTGTGTKGKVDSVVRWGTKFTITKGTKGYWLNVEDVKGTVRPQKYKIAYAKDPDKARVYMGSFLGYLYFKSDPNMLKLLKYSTK